MKINRKEDRTWLRWCCAGRMVRSGKETVYSVILPHLLNVGKETMPSAAPIGFICHMEGRD